jgi:ABC-2 type transport system permease protein
MKTFLIARATVRGTTWFSADGLRELGRKNRRWLSPVAALGVLVALGSFLSLIIATYSALAAVGAATGHPEILLFYGILAGWVFTFIGAVPLALSLIYYSRDTRLLLSLPVRPWQIIGARIALLYVSCLPAHLFLLVPALVMYAVRFGASALFVAAGLFNCLVLPLFPLSLALFLVLILAKLVNLSRFRVALEVAGMVVGVTLILCIQILVSRTMNSEIMGGAQAGVGSLPDLYAPIARAIPPAAWATGAFLGPTAAGSALVSFLVTAGCFAAVMLLAPLNFLSDVMERGERKRERKAVPGAADIRGMTRARTVRMSLIRRELAVLTSNSTFIFQETAELFIVPLMLFIYALVLPKEILGKALSFISATPLIGPIVLGVLSLMTNISSMSSTSISREGKRFSLSLTIPVAGREQIKAKLAMHILLLFPAYLLDVAIVTVLFKLPPRMLFFLIPAGLVFEVFSFMTGMFFDLKRPILSWTHPHQAVKNNVNSVVGPASIMLLMIALAAPAVPLLLAGFDAFFVSCLIPLAPLVLDILLLPRLFDMADRQYGGGLELGG